jgi:hypothetical protein
MNKFTFALVLGAGLVLSLAAPNAQAGPIVQSLSMADMTATQFNGLFAPTTGVAPLTQNFSFLNTGNVTVPAGSVTSEVFTGSGAATGVYAYAYQFTVNNATDSTTGEPTSVNSTSMLFNATPVVTSFTGANADTYLITSGSIGSLSAPVAATGQGVQTPSTIAWQPGTSTGSLTFQYLNPTTGTGPLAAGATSATIVVLSTQAPSQQNVFVSLQNPEPQNGYPVVYSPTAGTIDQVAAPEPATVLAWTTVIAALAMGHRFRRNHQPIVA